MVIVIVVLILAIVVFAVVFSMTRAARRGGAVADVSVPGTVVEGGRAVVTLEVTSTDRDNPAVIRLVDDAADRVFSEAPEGLDAVEVQNREGVTLGTRRREAPRQIALPDHLYEPHSRKARGPEVPPAEAQSAGEHVSSAPAEPGGPTAVPGRGLAEHFELADDIRARLSDPSDPVDLTRAILATAGMDATLDDDVFRVGDRAVVVIRCPLGSFVDPAALNGAYARFKASGAKKGIVVTPGSMSQNELRRRQALEPNLLHAGAEGIQRMADAASAGADPVDFAAIPATER